MKKIYESLRPATGVHLGGVKKISLAAREWLVQEVQVDFLTNKVIEELSFVAGRSLLELELIEDSYEFEEIPRTNAGGDFYETTITGLLNKMNPETLQLLESLREHEWVLICTDMFGQQRLIGNKEAAMIFQWAGKNANAGGGRQEARISFFFQSEKPAPFYSTLCEGYQNFTDVSQQLVEDDSETLFSFSGGNTVGITDVEFEYTTLDGGWSGYEKSYHTLSGGENSFTLGYNFISDFGPGIMKIKWRRRCPNGTFSAWAYKEITITAEEEGPEEPLCDGYENFTDVSKSLIAPEFTDARLSFTGGNTTGATEVKVIYTTSSGPTEVYNEEFTLSAGVTTLDFPFDFTPEFGVGTLRVEWRRVCLSGHSDWEDKEFPPID